MNNPLVAKRHLWDFHNEEYTLNKKNLEDLLTDLPNDICGNANLNESIKWQRSKRPFYVIRNENVTTGEMEDLHRVHKKSKLHQSELRTRKAKQPFKVIRQDEAIKHGTWSETEDKILRAAVE